MAARVISMVPILVDIDAFALPSFINAQPPPTVSHRVTILLIISGNPLFDPHHPTISLRI
jgi:hypothetical protein